MYNVLWLIIIEVNKVSNIFSERIKELRKKNNVTQGELAEEMGITAYHPSSFTEWVGKLKYEKIIKN